MKAILPFGVFEVIFLLIGCGATGPQMGYYEPKHPKYSIEMDKEGHKQGKEIWWYPNGIKKYEAVNMSGFREGIFTAWYSDGKKWYEGMERHGKPESTLTYWHPNGHMKSKALFRDGIQLERQDYDEDGHILVARGLVAKEATPSGEEKGKAEAEAEGARLRKAGLQIWASRVRQTVEGFWILPKQFEKERPFRAVAKIKVGRDGTILGVTWSEKSPSAVFNSLAQGTFKRIKKLPVFPPMIKEETLELQYEFISLGKTTPRRKLEARDPTEEAPAAEP